MNTGIGRRQRQVLDDLASIGCWRPATGRGIGRLTVAQVSATVKTLSARGLVVRGTDHRGEHWRLSPAGYSLLIHRAANDMGWLSADSAAYERVTSRISHLASLARMAASGPVTWSGDRP